MKYLFKTPLLLALFIALASCSSSSEEDCQPIICLNEGIQTIDCGCECPEGYSGADCATILTPSKVIINKVVINSFDDYSSWDTSTKPDITFNFEKADRTILYSHTSFINNAESNSPITFTLSPVYSITDVNTPIVFVLYDYDGNDLIPNADDQMDFGVFQPFNRENFPSKVKVSATNSATDVDVYLSYEF
jgi:hypothetical protein